MDFNFRTRNFLRRGNPLTVHVFGCNYVMLNQSLIFFVFELPHVKTQILNPLLPLEHLANGCSSHITQKYFIMNVFLSVASLSVISSWICILYFTYIYSTKK